MGHFYAQDEGQAFFRNDAYLHFNQFYVGQYFVWQIDNSRFETTDAAVQIYHAFLAEWNTSVLSEGN